MGRWQVGGLPPSYGSEALRLIRKGAGNAGSHGEIIASILCSINRDEQESMKAFASFIVHIMEYLSPHQLATHSLTTADIKHIEQDYSGVGWEALTEKMFKLGVVGVEGCIKIVEELYAMGYKRLKTGSHLGQDKKEAIHLFAKE